MRVAKLMDVVAVVCLSLFATPAIVLAQVSIAGRVTDTSGALLPGVTVEASSSSLIEKVRTAVTDDRGAYQLVDLTAGVYTVTFGLPGFTTVKREGLQLAGTFTATINAVMQVGSIQQMVTVTGETPVVDVQNVVQNQVLTREVMDILPTGKTFQNYAAVIPGMSITGIVRLSGQDVGGSESQGSHLLTIHGSQAHDMQNFIEGIPNNNSNSFGFQGIYIDSGSMQEFNYNIGASTAEVQTGGVHVNFIPKDGGNRFTGSVFAAYTNDKLSFDNTTDALRARGVRASNQMLKIYDVNPSFGGPIKQNRFWFYLSARRWGQDQRPVNAYYNKTPGTLTYTPDLSRPAIDDNRVESASVRPTWQITRRNKINGYFVLQTRLLGHSGISSLVPPEVTQRAINANTPFTQVSWTSTVSNRLLLEAGMSRLLFDQTFGPQPEVTPDLIPAIDLATGRRFRAPLSITRTVHGPVYQWKGTLSYVTGTHAFKTGVHVQKNRRDLTQTINGSMVLRLLNGIPNSVEVHTTPVTRSERLFPMLNMFAQDQWTLSRLTLTLGARVDHQNSYVPEQHLPPARFVGARDFAKIPDVPNWWDVSPRLGATYDLFGNGKTALKLAVNRYVNGELFSGITSRVNPLNTSVNSATRAWSDVNGDFIPQDSELGPLSNASFGQLAIRTHFDKDYTEGFGKRLNNWETLVGVQHELMSGVAANVNYYRRSYGNFLATDNTLTTAADYDPFCITEPVDARLPGGGGNQLCGFFDVTPTKFGQINDLVTFASNFGRQTDIYNGVDITLNARLPRGVGLSGGINVGRQATNNCDLVMNRPDVTFDGSTAGVLAPRTEAFCNVAPPFQSQVKLQGIYPLPWWGLRTSATFQSLPGPEILAVHTVRNPDIAPSLRRNLAAGAAGSVRVDLIPRSTLYDTRLYQTDLRLSKKVQFDRYRVWGNFDVYNLFNSDAILARNNTYGPLWGEVLQVLGARLIKFSAQLDF